MAEYRAQITLLLKDMASGAARSVGSALGGIGDRMRQSFQTALPYSKMLTVALGGAIVGGAIFATKAASNLGEQINKTSVVFGESASELQKWSRGAATGFGMSQRAALEAAGTFGNMLVPMGVSRDKAAEMSSAMVQLAGDMASFNNASPEETLLALRAGLAGETEPLRRFGVFLNEARIKQEAMNLGLSTGKGELTAQQKALAIYSIILKDTKDAQGDFARTYSSLPNLMRVIRGQVEDLGAAFGTLLAPIIAKVALGISNAFSKALKGIKAFTKAVEEEGLRGAIEKLFPPGTQATIAIIAGAIFGLLIPALVGLAVAGWNLTLAFAPFVAIGAAIGAIAYLIYKNWDIIGPVFAKVKEAILDLWAKARPVFTFLKAALDPLVDTIKTSFVSAWKSLKDTWASLAPYHDEMIMAFKILAGILGGIVVVGIFSAIGGMLIFVTVIAKVIKGITWLISQVVYFATHFRETMTNAWEWVKNKFSEGVTAVINFFANLVSSIVSSIIEINSQIPLWIGSAIGWMVKTVSDGISSVINFFLNLPGNIVSGLSSLANSVAHWFSAARDNATSRINTLVSAVVDWIASLPERVGSLLSQLPGTFRGWFDSARDSAVDRLHSLLEYARSLPGKLADIAADMGRAIWNGIKDWLGKVAEGFRKAFRGERSPGFVEIFQKDLERVKRIASEFPIGSIGAGIAGGFKIGGPMIAAPGIATPAITIHATVREESDAVLLARQLAWEMSNRGF